MTKQQLKLLTMMSDLVAMGLHEEAQAVLRCHVMPRNGDGWQFIMDHYGDDVRELQAWRDNRKEY